MEQLIVELVKQAPALAALIWLAWWFRSSIDASQDRFLTHIDKDAVRRENSESESLVAVQRFSQNCHDFQREIKTETHSILQKMATSLDNSTAMMSATNEVMRDVRDIMRDRETREEKH